MDSSPDHEGGGAAESYIANADEEDITFLVNASVYKQWRSQYVDEIELSVWNIDMVKFAISTTFENYGPIKTAIQRGVPDIIKHYIWIKANGADKFYIENPNFYKLSFASTFGNHLPSEMGDYCPTFCGGIFGLQADLGSPMVLERLHSQFDGSLDSQILYNPDDEYNYWMNPYKESSPNLRENSSLSVSSRKSGGGIGGVYSRLFKKRRHDSDKAPSETSGSFTPSGDGRRPSFASEPPNSVLDAPGKDDQSLASSASLYSIQVSEFPKAGCSGNFRTTNPSDLGNKDRLIDYIYMLNNENMNKRKLMKSALYKIRQGSGETRTFVRNLEKTRQMSDTFIYNTQYTSFPPPPSHHSKLLHVHHDVQPESKSDNPFYQVLSKKKNQPRLFSCFPFICRGGRNSKDSAKEDVPGGSSVHPYGHSKEDRSHSNSNFNPTEGRSVDSMDMDSPMNATRYSNEDEQLKKYSSENDIDSRFPPMVGRLPMINTIPEHSASSSILFAISKGLSNISSVEEGYSVFDSKHAPVKVDKIRKSGDKKNQQSVEALVEEMYIGSNASPSSQKTNITDASTSKMGPEDMDLFSKLSRDFTRHMSTASVEGSVYKLADVTDFTVLLTPEGVREVKRLLWCLNSYFSTTIEFLPIIPSLCCLLLIYLAPNAVLCLLYRFMTNCVASSDLEIGNRFFFVNRRGFVTFVTFVLSVMVFHVKKTVVHLRNLKVDLAAWVARSVQTGFSQILPFDYIVRIYGNFLFEGEIVLCRYCVALLKCISQKLLSTTSKEYAEELLYHIGLDDSIQIDKLTKIAFSLRIKKFDKKINSLDAPTPYLMNVKIRQFYRPRLATKSSILTETNWEFIWASLKPIYRILDPHNLYSSNIHGNTMNGLTKRLLEHGKSSSPALIFIKTAKLQVFGAFIPNLLNSLTKGYFTPQEMVYQMNSFVFTLFPYQKVYEFTSKNKTGVKISKDSIVVGANEPAIILDKTLSSGHTAACESFDSPQLSREAYFKPFTIEVWTLS